MEINLNKKVDLTVVNSLTSVDQIVKLISTDNKIFYMNRNVAD